jgi:Holliday junction resolvase RusA-like endonuclease
LVLSGHLNEVNMIILNVNPVAKPRMTRSDKWKKRKATDKYWEYKDKIREYKFILPIPYKMTFYLQTPKSYSKAKQALLEGQPHLVRPDKDNLEKGFLDALFEEDSHIWSGWVEKRYSMNPRIEIEALDEKI